MTAFEGTTDQFPEHAHSRAALLERARQLAWYHTLRLDDSLTTPGIFALDEFQPFYLLPASLRGFRCLEVGTGNGYWAFLMERRGADSVTATDLGDYYDVDFSHVHGRPHPCPSPSAPGAFGEPYRVAATLLGSRVEYRIRSVYALDTAGLGTFDFVFCGSVLMHLFAPVVALRQMAALCRSTCVITTQTDVALDGEPLVRYRGTDIPFVHFIPSPTCLGLMLRSCGYDTVLRGPTFLLRFRDRADNPDELPHTTFVCVKPGAVPVFDVGSSRLLAEPERRAALDVVWAPPAVAPGRDFWMLVRVVNGSRSAWRVDGPGHELRITGTCRLRGARRVEAPPLPVQLPFVDYLPAGVSTLACVRLTAPVGEGTLDVELDVAQGRDRFGSGRAAASIPVAAGSQVDVSPFVPPAGSRPFERAWRAVRVLPGYGAARSVVKRMLSHLP